ncbi:MAG: thiopeptide-type bacteriocin biosynthesis protein [Acidobacteriota bacterium]
MKAIKEFERIKLKRIFIPGEEWVYFKIYSGIKTADRILVEIILPLTKFLKKERILKNWFFIRYRDSDNHLRIRFRMNQPEYKAKIEELIYKRLRYYVDEDLVWKIQIDTYNREFERYGYDLIELSEEFFCYDSEMVLKILSVVNGDDGENLRWLFGLNAIDQLLSDFKFDLKSKLDLINKLRNGFGLEFRENKNTRKQLEKKFRSQRSSVTNIINGNDNSTKNNKTINKIISARSERSERLLELIISLYKNDNLKSNFPNFIESYLHMMVNRLFRTNQRLHEFVLYDFLVRYYKSEIAKIKYNKIK